MSPWVKFTLPRIGASLAGAHWADVVAQVKALGDSDLPNEQKFERVKSFIIESGCTLASFILNLVIEIAVTWCASQGAIDLKDSR